MPLCRTPPLQQLLYNTRSNYIGTCYKSLEPRPNPTLVLPTPHAAVSPWTTTLSSFLQDVCLAAGGRLPSAAWCLENICIFTFDLLLPLPCVNCQSKGANNKVYGKHLPGLPASTAAVAAAGGAGAIEGA